MNISVKRWIVWLLLTVLLLQKATGICIAAAPEESELYARSAVLMDADSGRVLYEKNGYEQLPMASTTKIMTCIVALEQGNRKEVVTASSYAAGQPAVHLGMRSGQQYLLEDLLYSLMLESHNDSAVAIAEHIGGSVEGFAAMMNQKARDIGCADTFFITPNGLDAEKTVDGETYAHSTTARDLARIMKYCLTESEKREEFLAITRTISHSFCSVDGKNSYSVKNHNAFLQMMEGALSGKTGFTGKAGYCYVGALEREGKRYIVALLACGWPNNKSYKWSDTKKLMNYALAEYEYQTIRWNETLPMLPVTNAAPADGSLYGKTQAELMIAGETELTVLLGKEETVKAELRLIPELSAPYEAGSQVGKLIYTLDGEVLAAYPVVTKHGAKKQDFMWYLEWVREAFLP